MNKSDTEALAQDLNTVLCHATPDTIQARVDTVWLVCNTVSLTLRGKSREFSAEGFYARVFNGFEQYLPTRTPVRK